MKNYIDYIIADASGKCGTLINSDYNFKKECNEAITNFDTFIELFIKHPKLPKYVKKQESYIKTFKQKAEELANNAMISTGKGTYDDNLRFKFTLLIWGIIWH
jgi:hypothetical protein